MHANRFTALLDTCALVGVLKRNLLLSLAEADLFRPRWTALILDELERSLGRIFDGKGDPNAAEAARLNRSRVERAFPDASVDGYEPFIDGVKIPDPDDRHVVAAAILAEASVIVTDNTKHFPTAVLALINLGVKTVDEFIADAIDLDVGTAVAAVRVSFRKPEMSAADLLIRMEGQGLTLSVDLLRDHVASL